MPQLYPQPVSSTIGVTINAGDGLVGGGTVTLGQSVGISEQAPRVSFTTTPAPDGLIGSFTIQGPIPPGQVDVYVDGAVQLLDDYNLVGSQIQFNTPPASGVDIFAVYAPTADGFQQFTLTPAADGTVTSFTFPSALPSARYVDVYDASGLLLTAGTDYTLNLIAGVWSVVFTVAPAASATPVAVFSVTDFSDRNQYALSPAPNGTVTRFSITGGVPKTTADVFSSGLYQGTDVCTLNLIAGVWVIDFVAAPLTGQILLAVF